MNYDNNGQMHSIFYNKAVANKTSYCDYDEDNELTLNITNDDSSFCNDKYLKHISSITFLLMDIFLKDLLNMKE